MTKICFKGTSCAFLVEIILSQCIGCGKTLPQKYLLKICFCLKNEKIEKSGNNGTFNYIFAEVLKNL